MAGSETLQPVRQLRRVKRGPGDTAAWKLPGLGGRSPLAAPGRPVSSRPRAARVLSRGRPRPRPAGRPAGRRPPRARLNSLPPLLPARGPGPGRGPRARRGPGSLPGPRSEPPARGDGRAPPGGPAGSGLSAAPSEAPGGSRGGAHPPDEVGAVAAEGGLLEEARDEAVVLHLVHVLLPQRPFAGEAVGHVLRRRRLGGREDVSHGPSPPPAAGGAGGGRGRPGAGRARSEAEPRARCGRSALTAAPALALPSRAAGAARPPRMPERGPADGAGARGEGRIRF